MPRTIVITIPKEETDSLLDELKKEKGLVGLKVQRNGSVQPPGDVITLDVVNRALNPVLLIMDRYEIGQREGTSFSTSEPASLISSSFKMELTRDTNEATWEEMETTAGNSSNMTLGMLMLMTISGIISAIGILTNSIHVVVGAMIIAPGFIPITRMALGIVTKSAAFTRGLLDTVKGYLALMFGSAATMLIYKLTTDIDLQGKATYLAAGELTSYWTTISISSVVVSIVAGIAGGLLIATKRSVLTNGVMIALALIPSAALISMALVEGEYDLSLKAFERFIIDLGLVIVLSYAVFAWKHKQVHKREMIL